jgi:putative membrane protein
MFWMHDGGMGWGWGVFGMVWMLLFWGSIIALVVWGINRLTKAGDSPRSQTPLDIARTRYARGEIRREEFEQLKRDLG